MAIFGKKKVVDWTGKAEGNLGTPRRKVYSQESTPVSSSSSGSGDSSQFSIFGGAMPSSTSSPGYVSENSEGGSNLTPEEKRQRLGRRLLDMTNKIEDLSNQIYHLQQRIEVLEKKNSSGYD
jgi:hypothetical protein